MNSTDTRPNRDGALTTIRIVVWVFLVAAVALSFSHIVESGYQLGLGWESWTLPLFVDGLALVGKVSMIERFPRRFRRSGMRLLMLGGSLSLAANVYAGHNLGQRVFGVLVVAGFMALESHATKAAEAVASLARRVRNAARQAAAPAPAAVVVPAPPVVVAEAPAHPVRASRPRGSQNRGLRGPLPSPLTGRQLVAVQ